MPRIRNVGGVRPQPFFVRVSRFKRNRAFGFEFSIQSSVFGGATTVEKVKLFSTWTRSTVIFYSM